VIAITGASGYIGGRIHAALASRGRTVRGLVRRPDAARGDAFFALDSPVPDTALAGAEVLIHAAHDFTPRGEADLRRVNLEGSRRLLDAARAAGIARVLFISSMAAFEHARTPYGRVKLELEREVAARGGASIRPGTVFGTPPGGLFAALDRAVRSLPMLPDFGPRARLPVVHVDDLVMVVEAWLARDAEVGPRPISAAHPELVSFRRILEVIASAADRHARLLPTPPGLALAGLRALESVGLHAPFRSESLTGMLHGNPDPQLTPEVLGVSLRPYDERSLRSRE
jgi:nucleoside-diphosphate-sugar epimerase